MRFIAVALAMLLLLGGVANAGDCVEVPLHEFTPESLQEFIEEEHPDFVTNLVCCCYTNVHYPFFDYFSRSSISYLEGYCCYVENEDCDTYTYSYIYYFEPIAHEGIMNKRDAEGKLEYHLVDKCYEVAMCECRGSPPVSCPDITTTWMPEMVAIFECDECPIPPSE